MRVFHGAFISRQGPVMEKRDDHFVLYDESMRQSVSHLLAFLTPIKLTLVQISVPMEDVQKILIYQDASQATKEIHYLWQDEPCAIGNFIQVTGDCSHCGKEGFITAISKCSGTTVYDFCQHVD